MRFFKPPNEKGEKFTFDSQTSLDLIFDFKAKGYVNDDYQITDTLIQDIENNTFKVPDKLKDHEAQRQG
ncbi:MAG: hypothetical protein U9N77_12670 [Thermodesulfobacteriota bacterium]|nr:hypothetical protein [Thermodesulfobacteriota bacterium]